ncbi:MAG: hypothetical protein CSA49_01550 [Gammaproteobacteria bacterium]|nr:MAG: hypothetical protein CSA49_01550 [Gammaproteobacteria bacterium]
MLSSLIPGCSRSDSQSHLYRPAPAKTATVTFVRNQNTPGSQVVTAISIDNWLVGTLAAGEHLTINYPVGQHQVSVKGHTMPLTFKNSREYFFLIEQNEFGQVKSIRNILPKDAVKYMNSR